MRFVPYIFALLCVAPCRLIALTVTSDGPGNIFTAGDRPELTAHDAQGKVTYQITDYSGHPVASGASTTIKLPALNPGWYGVKCSDDKSSVTTSIGVVIDRKGAPLPAEGRVCIDGATNGLVYKPEYRKPIAQMLRMAGIPWVRERLAWSAAEPESGRYDWGTFQTVADTFAAEGVRVCAVWIFSPAWTHPTNPNTLYPDDLRTVYSFTKEAARRFSGKVQAWEMWNEPEIDFWLDTADRFTGLCKAAYLGFKDGDPRVTVLQGALCLGPSPFSTATYEAGLGEYYDVFNWHIYDLPSVYPKSLADYRGHLESYKLTGRPSWLTEAGIRLYGSVGEGNKLLSEDDLKRQCRFVPRSAAMSLAAGDEKNFLFVLPDYLENRIQFGMLNADLSPRPAFVALSAAANIIGVSDYLGQLEVGEPGVVSQVFSTPRGNVVVAWSDKEAEISVPTEQHSVKLADVFGKETAVTAENGAVRLKVGPDAIYLIHVGNRVRKQLTGVPVARGRMPKNAPSRIVIVGHTDTPIHKGMNAYMLGTGRDTDKTLKFNYDVEVYNFGSKSGASGNVEVVAPEGWRVEEPKRPVSLGPMDRKVLSFTVSPKLGFRGTVKVVARATFRGERVQPSISCFAVNPASEVPVKREALDWSDPARWQTPPGLHDYTLTANGGALHCDVRTNARPNGDPWAYPEMRFEKPMDFSAYDGIAFDLKCDLNDANSWVRMTLVKPNGAQYMNGTRVYGDKRRIVFMFREMWQTSFISPDPEHNLDLSKIVAVKLGAGTTQPSMAFDIDGWELVKF